MYEVRHALEKANGGLKLRSDDPGGSGSTFSALIGGFSVAIVLGVSLVFVVANTSRAPLLRGARLSGADLLGTRISQSDLEGACGDATTKLPHGLWVRPCQ
jgi:hypothetical protein